MSAGPAFAGAGTAPEVEEIEEVDVTLAPPWITILHNCDCHTFEDVVKQLIKAIACSEDRALVFSDGRLAGIVSPADVSRAVERLGRKPGRFGSARR